MKKQRMILSSVLSFFLMFGNLQMNLFAEESEQPAEEQYNEVLEETSEEDQQEIEEVTEDNEEEMQETPSEEVTEEEPEEETPVEVTEPEEPSEPETEIPSEEISENTEEEPVPEVEPVAEETPSEEVTEEEPEEETPAEVTESEEDPEAALEEEEETDEEEEGLSDLISEVEIETELDESEELVMYPYSADADSPVGAQVSVGRNTVKIRINQVGTTGTAQLYRFAANEYYEKDPLHGLSTKTAETGTLVANYECGTSLEYEFNRYRVDGTDNLYNKYYLIQGSEILVGPFYATEIASVRSMPPFEVNSKKGIAHEDGTTLAIAKEMGATNTCINMDLGSLIIRNEDAEGNPVDNSTRGDVIEFESNGETFYFNANYIKAIDGDVSSYTREGMNVTLIVIAWYNTDFNVYPESLVYTKDNHQTMAFNTSNDRGLKYFIAAMEFLGDRYSRSSAYGKVNKYIIGNEIDYTYDWSLILPEKDENGGYSWADLDTFMEEYSRGFRMANNAIKKYNSDAKVTISFTHNWARARRDCYTTSLPNTNRMYNSYAPKEMLDWMNTIEKARGDYDWSISVHPYPIGTVSTNPLVTDINRSDGTLPVTGDWRTSPWITCVNLELYQQYLEQPASRYNGQIREITMTETSVCNVWKENVSSAEYQRSINEQAATIAQYYYRAANIDCITEMAYFQVHDAYYRYGLMEEDGTRKPSYDIWKYIDTNLTYNYANRYLKYISSTATSYQDLMDATHSGFDWGTAWNENNIIRRYIEGIDVERDVSTDKEEYDANDPILVTAIGAEGDMIGLYRASDDLDLAEPLYYYYMNTTYHNTRITSNKPYDILAYGTISIPRISEAKLPAGNYKIAIRSSSTGEFKSVNIRIKGNYSFGSSTFALTTNKDVYNVGENIIVSATGGSGGWVGLYGRDDKPGDITSIYWYYIDRPESGILTGKPTIIQMTKSERSISTVPSGEYTVYLFDENSSGSYNVMAKKDITIEGNSFIEPLVSVEYVLSNDTDGFANGVVTITKDNENVSAGNCVMYWADESGTPLAGYTALAMFKLTGAVTKHEMFTHTIIPEGAKKLIAYASDGESLSAEYVSTDLPENCSYVFDSTPLAEFQIISDVHVTTAAGATGEVKLSNQHFSMMLEDVKQNSPDSIGIFINGDIANTGSETEFKMVYSLYNKSLYAGDGNLPEIHMAVGNHDWLAGNPKDQFQKYAKILNSNLEEQPEHVYYDEYVNGYHFVYLGGEQPGLHAVLSKEQLEWLDSLLEKDTKENPDKPVFLFLHQSFYNTVAGSLPGQGWDGVSNETALKKVLQKYGQLILVNGHSHWELNSTNCMYPGDDQLPNALNTAAVGYLWSSYNVIGGEFEDGSHGYYVRVYDDKVVFLGRDFENNLWIPSAAFVLKENKVVTGKDEYEIALGSASVNLEASGADGGFLSYLSLDPEIASITEDGTVIPRSTGEATMVITAFGNDKTVISRKRVKVKITDINVKRVAGQSRYDTSIAVAEELKIKMNMTKFDSVILASGLEFADALAGSYLSYVKNAPILLTQQKPMGTLNVVEMINAYISDNLNEGGTIYVLGGEKAVPSECLDGLEGFEIKRLQGEMRYDTNIEILKEAGVTNEDILVATAWSFADSLSASGTKRPVLLVGKDGLTDRQKEYLGTLNGNTYYILGGEKAVTEAVEKEIRGYSSNVKRLKGDTRHETSVKIAEEFFEKPKDVILSYSYNFPDGLCGGLLSALTDAPLILTRAGDEDIALAYCRKHNLSSGYILGGKSMIPSDSAAYILRYDPDIEL